MPWQSLLETRDRLPAGPLDDWYAALLERAGDSSPFALAVLGGCLAATPGLAFLAGYQGAMKEFDLPVPDNYVYEGDYHMESGASGAEQLLSLGVTAIFACNDLMAAGVLQAAEQRGVDVPRQLSVVGYDNNPICKLLRVPLTTIAQPADLMGRRACRILLEKIDQVSDLHTDYYFSPGLKVRKSTAAKGEGR